MPIAGYDRQVGPGATNVVDVPTETQGFVDQQGFRATEQFTNNMTRMALHEKQRADDIITKDWFNKVTAAKNDLMYNEQSGWTKIAGDNVFKGDFIADQKKALEDVFEGADSLIKNREQRDFVANMKSKIMGEYEKNLHIHFAGQKQIKSRETNKALIATYKEEAILNFGDMEKVFSSAEGINDVYKDFVKDGEMSAEAAGVAAKEQTSNLYLGVIARMTEVPGNEGKAAEFFNNVSKGNLLTSGDLSRAEKLLEIYKKDSKALYNMRNIVSKVGDDLAGQRNMLNKINDLQEYQQTRSLLNQYNSDQRAILEQQSNNRIVETANFFKSWQKEREELRKAGTYDPYASLKGEDALPPRIKVDLTQRELKEAIALFDPPATDKPEVVEMLHHMYINDPEKFASINWLMYSSVLSQKTIEKNRKLARGLAAKESKSLEDLAKAKADSVVLDSMAEQAGMDKSEKSAFKTRAHMLLRDIQETTGREYGPEEQKKFFRSILEEMTLVQNPWYRNDKEGFITDLVYEDIGQDDRERIISIFRKNNVMYPTRDQVLKYYISERAMQDGS